MVSLVVTFPDMPGFPATVFSLFEGLPLAIILVSLILRILRLHSEGGLVGAEFRLTILFFQHLKNVPSGLHVSDEKSDLRIVSPVSNASFCSIFHIFFVFSFEKFDNDISNDRFGEFILFRVYSASSIFGFFSFNKCGAFSAITASDVHSVLALLSFALPHFRDIAFLTN